MTIARVGATSAFSTDSNGFTTAAQNTTGADLIVIIACESDNPGSGVATAITDSKSNTWTALTAQTNNGHRARIWYAWNAIVGTGHTFTMSGTANFPAMAIAWYSGTQTASDPFDQQNGANATFQPTIAMGSITPSVANSLIIDGLCRDQQANVPTINASQTLVANVTNAGFGHALAAIAEEIQTTATARSPTWTTTGNSSIAGVMASFKPAAGGGSGTFEDDAPPVVVTWADRSVVGVWG